MQNNVAEKEETQEVEVVEVPEAEAPENVSRETLEEAPEAEAPEQEAEKSDDDELEQYSESVKRRISKITSKYREEERQRQAAIEYAEAVKKQNEELRARLDKVDQAYVGEFGNRVESDAAAAKEEYKKAYEEGDADAMFAAQEKISRIALEKARYEEANRRNEERKAQPEQQPEVSQAPGQPASAAPDPKAEAWAEKNEWFGSDQAMTYAAFGIHRQLVEEDGFDPTSDDYYSELDKRVRSKFPQEFAETKRDTGPRVASAESTASRSSAGKGRRTVKLTPSQIAIAKRLNVPLEEYAKYVKE